MLALVLVSKVTHEFQFVGLERTMFVSITDRMLVGHDRDRSSTVLNSSIQKENCEKETPKLLVRFAHTELLVPFPQLTFTLVSAIILRGKCVTVCALLLKM
jgi:hypothetical protein